MSPTSDRPAKRRRRRTTPKSSPARPGTASVRIPRAPISKRPALPERRVPPRMGITSPAGVRPMRRVWKSVKSRAETLVRNSLRVPSPNSKIPEFSMKNSRRSGKNRGKRVRLTWSWSTSTWEKSVRYVASNVRRDVTPYFRSPPASSSFPVPVAPPVPDATEPRAYGLMRRLRPCRSPCRAVKLPARDTFGWNSWRSSGAQVADSLMRRMRRWTLNPQSCAPSAPSKRRVVQGMAISTVQPKSVTSVATSTTASHA